MNQNMNGFNHARTLTGVRELLYNYQNKSGLVGPNRSVVLEKCLSAAIAYSAPCFAGDITEMTPFYRNTVQYMAMRLISQVNEICIVNTDRVLADVELLWSARYSAINSPLVNCGLRDFHGSLVQGDNLSSHYELWVRKFLTALHAEWTMLAGGE